MILGYNTTLTLRPHEGSIPSQPALGRALQGFQIDIPTPDLRGPPREGDDDGGDGGDGNEDDSKRGPHFIKDVTVSVTTLFPRLQEPEF